MREIRTSGSMSGKWKRSMVKLMRHRHTKEPATDRPNLNHRATSRLYHVVSGLLMRRGKIGDNGKWIDTGKLEPFTTTSLNSHWSGNGWAMWVESRNKEFYANRMKVLKFQHTSFLAGDKVRGAGEWVVEQGLLKKMSGRSGHYQPSLDHLLQALRDLQGMNVAALDNVDVILYERSMLSSYAQKIIKWRDLKNVANPNQTYKVDPKAA
jgi:hypothetical protein